MTVVVGLQWVL